jgi:hypothetical protein
MKAIVMESLGSVGSACFALYRNSLAVATPGRLAAGSTGIRLPQF